MSKTTVTITAMCVVEDQWFSVRDGRLCNTYELFLAYDNKQLWSRTTQRMSDDYPGDYESVWEQLVPPSDVSNVTFLAATQIAVGGDDHDRPRDGRNDRVRLFAACADGTLFQCELGSTETDWQSISPP